MSKITYLRPEASEDTFVQIGDALKGNSAIATLIERAKQRQIDKYHYENRPSRRARQEDEDA